MRVRSLIIVLLVVCVASATAASTSNDLIAHYPLHTNGSDSAGTNDNFILGHDHFAHGVLYIDGTYFPPAPLYVGQSPIYRGTPLLHDFSYQSFTVGLDFYPLRERVPKPKLYMNKVEQVLDKFTHGFYRQWLVRGDWGKRNILTGGRSYRWIGFNRDGNELSLTLNNQRFIHRFKGAPVKANRWHHLICSVNLRERKILTWLDGKELEAIILPQNFQLEIIGSPDEATDQEFTFTNFSNGAVFYGYAAELKMFGRALIRSELAAESIEAPKHWPEFPPQSLSLPTIILTSVVVGLPVAFWILRRIRQRRSA